MTERYIAISDGLQLRRGDEVHVAFVKGQGMDTQIVKRGRVVRAFRRLVIATLRIHNDGKPGTAAYCGEPMKARLL